MSVFLCNVGIQLQNYIKKQKDLNHIDGKISMKREYKKAFQQEKLAERLFYIICA